MGDVVFVVLFVLAIAMMTCLPLASRTEEAAWIAVVFAFCIALCVRWAAAGSPSLSWLSTEAADFIVVAAACVGLGAIGLKPPAPTMAE